METTSQEPRRSRIVKATAKGGETPSRICTVASNRLGAIA
jgi:hypothetical protein